MLPDSDKKPTAHKLVHPTYYFTIPDNTNEFAYWLRDVLTGVVIIKPRDEFTVMLYSRNQFKQHGDLGAVEIHIDPSEDGMSSSIKYVVLRPESEFWSNIIIYEIGMRYPDIRQRIQKCLTVKKSKMIHSHSQGATTFMIGHSDNPMTATLLADWLWGEIMLANTAGKFSEVRDEDGRLFQMFPQPRTERGENNGNIEVRAMRGPVPKAEYAGVVICLEHGYPIELAGIQEYSVVIVHYISQTRHTIKVTVRSFVQDVFSQWTDVLNEMVSNHPATQAEKRLEKEIEPTSKPESDHWLFSRSDRAKIVEEWREAKSSRRASNKNAWAKSNYNITGKTLKRYEVDYDKRESDT